MNGLANPALLLPPGGAGVDLTPPVTSEATLKKLREDRRVVRLLRDLAAGKWRDILLQVSQHQFPLVENAAGKLSALVVKLNLVGPAMELHAETLAGERSNVSTADGFDAQQEAVNRIAARSLWDQQLLIAAELTNIEGSAAVRVGVDTTSGGHGVVIGVEDNEVCFPTGRLGPDQQPTAWERRWVIEIEDPADRRKKINVLRIESHWLPEGSPVAVIAQRAYRVESSDPLGSWVGAKGVEPFDLGKVAPGVAEITPLPTQALDIVQLVIGRRPVGGTAGAPPRTRLNPNDLDLLDAVTASLSRLVRSMELHAEPKMRVPEEALDKKTGALPKRTMLFVDPEKKLEYITLDAKFTEMLDVLDRLVDHALMSVRTARVLLGLPKKDGGQATTLGELRMNAQGTLSAARTASTWITPPLERAWTLATVMESRMPGGGFDCAPVNVRLSPGLFTTFDDRVESQGKALSMRLTSEWHAVAAVHGERNADAVIAEMRKDEERRSDLAARSLMLDIGGTGGGFGDGGSRSGSGGDPSRVATEKSGASADGGIE